MQRSPVRTEACSNRGFTLMETIVVLLLLGILAAVIIVRGTAADEAKVQAEINTIKGHLRYAQYLAMNDIAPFKWGIEIGSSSYELVKYDGLTKTAHTFTFPGESSATHIFASGVSATGAPAVLFDEWGNPGATDLNVALNGQSITITGNTGFIP